VTSSLESTDVTGLVVVVVVVVVVRVVVFCVWFSVRTWQ